MEAIGCALFAFAVATIVVPTGARIVGTILMVMGTLLHNHGDRLSDAVDAYRGK